MCSAESTWGTEISYTFLYSCSISALKESSLLTWLLHPPCSKKRPRSCFGSNFPPVHLQGSVGNTNCQDHKYTPSYPAQGAAPSGLQHTPHHPLPRLFRPVKRYRHVPLSMQMRGICLPVLWLHIYPTLCTHKQSAHEHRWCMIHSGALITDCCWLWIGPTAPGNHRRQLYSSVMILQPKASAALP